MKQIQKLFLGKTDFDFRESSIMIVLPGIFDLSGLRCKEKNQEKTIEKHQLVEICLIEKLMAEIQLLFMEKL